MNRRLSKFRVWLMIAFPFVWGVLLSGSAFAQASGEEIVIPDVPFPAFIAILFMPPMIGIFVVCVMRSGRRDRDKVESYRATRLAEIQEGPKVVQRKRPERKAAEVSPEAKSALTLSIVGCFLFGVPGLFGMLKGLAAKKNIASDRRLTGEGTATVAIVVGILAMLIWVAGVLVIAAIFLL